MLVYLEPRVVVHTDRYGVVEFVDLMNDREFEHYRASIKASKFDSNPQRR